MAGESEEVAMRGGVGMEVERGTIRLPDTLSKDLSGEGKVELEARLLILLADPSLAPGSLLARMVMKAVAADPKAAMEVARSKHGLRALAGGLPGGSDDANKQNQGRADATARALSAVLSNLEGLELSAASKELMAAGVLGGLCRALESPQTPPGIAAHCIRALHRLVQADDARAGEVGKACLPSLLHLLGDAEPRVGEEAARLLTAIAAATSPRREGDSAAEQEQGEDLMIEAAGRLAGVVGAASDKHTKQASALAMAAVVRAGGEAAAQVAVRGGAGAKLLGMLGGKSGRQAAAEALLELAGTRSGLSNLAALEWGRVGSNEAEEVGESGRGAVTSALGKLLAVAGRRAAGGRTAAARALAALAASGDPGWMEAVPRKGRLRRVLAMLAGPLLPDAEMEGGMMSSSVAADTEGAGFGHDGEERQAAAEAVAAMVGNAELAAAAARGGALSTLVKVLDNRPATSPEVPAACRAIAAIAQTKELVLLAMDCGCITTIIRLLGTGKMPEEQEVVEAAAHTLAAILVVGSGEIVLNPYVEISSCAVASAINENNWRHSPVAAAAALSIVPLLAEAMTPRACLGCTALRNSLGTLLKSHVDGCCQASVRICLALVSSSEARLEVVHAGLVPMMLSVLDRRSEDSTSLLVLEALGKIFTDPRVDSYMPVDQLLGGLLGMLEALSTSALDMAPDILQVVLDSLTGLVPNPQFVSKLVSSGALPAVLGMLRSCDPLVTFKAEKLLAAVASTATRGRATLASSSAIQDMVMALESQLDAGKPASFPLVEALRELSRDPHCCRQMVEAGVAALIPRIILDTANSLEMRVLAACLAGAVCSLPNACQAMRQPCVATSLWNLLLQLQACPSDCQRESLSGVAFALSALLRDAGASGGLQMQAGSIGGDVGMPVDGAGGARMLATLLFCPDGSEDCRTSEAAAVIICARASGLLPAGVQMSAATSRFSAMVAETQGALDILVLMLGAERPTSQKSAAVSALYHLGATSPASRAAIAKTPGLVRGLSAVLSLPYSCTRALGHAVRLLALVAQDTALHLEIAASGALAPIARLLHSVASCLRRSVAAPLDTASSHAAVSLLARLSSSKFRRHDLICASGAVEALVAVLNSVPDSKGVAAAQSILQQGALLVLLPLAQAGQSARQLHQAGAAMAVMGMALRDRGNMEEFSVCAALEVFSAICKSPLAGPHQAGVMLSDKQFLDRVAQLLTDLIKEQLSRPENNRRAADRMVHATCEVITALSRAPEPMAGWTCEALLNCDAVTLLLDLLMDSEAHCREAAKAIGSMAAAHDAVQAAVILNGGIEQLLNLVENVNPAAMNDVISASESCLQHNQDAAATACDAGAVPLLCGLLKDGNDIQVRCAASKCLCSLLLGAKASASSALVDAGGLSLLAGILRDKIGQDGKGSDSMMVTAALRVMIAGLAGDRELIGQELVGESGLLNCLAELVAEDVEEEKRGAAAELIAKLPLGEAGGSLPMMAAVPGLVHMVKNLPRNSEAVGSAARALAALAVSPRNEPRIVKGGALMPMLSLLQRSTPGTRAAACCALSALITSNNENLTPLVTGGVVKPATDVVLDDAVPLDGRLAALRILKDAAFSDFYFQHIRESGAMSRLMSRLPNLSSTAVRLACLDLWAQCLTRHRWALEDAGTISPGVAVVLDDAGAYSDQEVDAARAALKTLAARLCRQGDKERHDILSALLSWEHPSSMRGTSAETERRPDALSSQCADSLGVNEAAAIKVEALRNFLSGISSELCVALLKSSNWDLPAAVETALQGSLASQAASGRRAASSSPSFGRSSNPCSSDTEQSQTCSSHQPSSTARQRFAGCPAFPAAPPAMARTQQPYSNGTLQRPQPEGYQQSSVRRTPEDIQAAERAAAGIFGQDRPSSAYSFAGSAIPMQRTHYAGVAEAAKMKPNMASRGLQPESSALRRSVSLDDQAPRKRVGKQPNAAVQQRIRQRQAEVKAMLQDRHDFEQQKVRIRDRVKKKLVEVERSNDLVHVLKSFGFLCDAGTLKKTFRLAMIDLHPDKVAQGGASSLQEAVRKEEMFKILMSKRSLLDQ